jgi:hypothetical protein
VKSSVTELQVIAKGGSVRPNAVYYITKCLVPSLSRLLALAGADVEQWWSETARDTRSRCAGTVAVVREEGEGGSELMRVWGQSGCVAVQQQQQHQKQQQRKIENYMQSDMCCVCDLNHAQVFVSSTFPPRHHHPNNCNNCYRITAATVIGI